MKPQMLALAASTLMLCAAAARADTIVPGTANPNLAGRADAYGCCSGDTAPLQSPPADTDVPIVGCQVLTFSATGQVSYVPSNPTGNNPDGDNGYTMSNYGDGISAPVGVRTNALVGVFLSDESPTGTTTPDRLDFSSGLDFGALAPQVGQIFFIGDGLTSDSNAGQSGGSTQQFIVPGTATRLFLGMVDGSGWANNSGSFTVTTQTSNATFTCGDAVAPTGSSATDALFVLRAAVGTRACLMCVCDVDSSATITSTDALVVLRDAVGLPQDLACPACCIPAQTAAEAR